MGLFNPGEMHRIGYAYWQNGDKEEADNWINQQRKLCEESIKIGRDYLGSYYDLAAVCSFFGEKAKAFENLRLFNKFQIVPLWCLTLIKNDPLFNNIRNEQEFKKIVKDAESKYQAEHERVRKWLEEQGMH